MLFETYSFAGLELKNRLVRSATYEKRADIDGFVTDYLITFYRELAKGGSGLIVTGNALVHVTGRTVPNMLCIHNDFYIDRLKRLTEVAHRYDTKIVMQLVHGGRQCFPALLGGEQPVAPSAVHDPSIRVTPREMTNEEIWEVIDSFGSASRRALQAGFDGIQLHGAHGYLISQFLSPYTNRREDYWGGDEERRFHFVEEICKAIRDEVGSQYPVLIKMNADDGLDDGICPDEAVRIGLRLQMLGIDAIELSGGMYESALKTARTGILKEEQEAYFRDAARLMRKDVHLPLILVGGMRSKAIMEEVIREGDADLVSLSRPLIREPDLPNKFREGKERADCISCNGCMRFQKLDVVRCVQIER